MSAAPARFTFDLDLGGGHHEDRNASLSDAAVAELIANARSEGIAAGKAEGERSALAAAAKAQAAAAEALGTRVAKMVAAMDETRQQVVTEGIELALSISRKLAGGLIAREPTAEIEPLVAECMATLEGVPHLVIRCEPKLADAVRDIATGKMTTSGFTGRLVVLGDPDIAIGDVRIEWADGGVARDIRQLSAQVDARIAQYFAARGQRNEETEQ